VLESVIGGVVRAKFSVEISQDSDADGVAHTLDCTRGYAVVRQEHVSSVGTVVVRTMSRIRR